MLLVGIFTSAINVSQDAELRRDFRKSVMGQLTLLRTIGITQMEKQLVKNFKTAEKRIANRETVEESYPEEDVKQIVHEVLEELKRRNLDKTKES